MHPVYGLFKSKGLLSLVFSSSASTSTVSSMPTRQPQRCWEWDAWLMIGLAEEYLCTPMLCCAGQEWCNVLPQSTSSTQVLDRSVKSTSLVFSIQTKGAEILKKINSVSLQTTLWGEQWGRRLILFPYRCLLQTPTENSLALILYYVLGLAMQGVWLVQKVIDMNLSFA